MVSLSYRHGGHLPCVSRHVPWAGAAACAWCCVEHCGFAKPVVFFFAGHHDMGPRLVGSHTCVSRVAHIAWMGSTTQCNGCRLALLAPGSAILPCSGRRAYWASWNKVGGLTRMTVQVVVCYLQGTRLGGAGRYIHPPPVVRSALLKLNVLLLCHSPGSIASW